MCSSRSACRSRSSSRSAARSACRHARTTRSTCAAVPASATSSSACSVSGVATRVTARTFEEETCPRRIASLGPEHDTVSVPAGGVDAGGDVPAGTRGPVHRAAAVCPGPHAARRQAALAEDGGIRVGQETARRIACDAATVTMRHGADGGVLDVGRRTRTVSPALRRALAARDGQCRFPGCAARRCDAHHIRHWADGGETALPNLVLLCRRHHRSVHEEGFRVRVDGDGAMTFLRPDGRPLPEAPAAPACGGPALAPVDRRRAAAGIGIDADTAPRWWGERLDLGWAIGVLWRPRDGADPAAGVPAGTSGP